MIHVNVSTVYQHVTHTVCVQKERDSEKMKHRDKERENDNRPCKYQRIKKEI